jgi:hypothetical protein
MLTNCPLCNGIVIEETYDDAEEFYNAGYFIEYYYCTSCDARILFTSREDYFDYEDFDIV